MLNVIADVRESISRFICMYDYEPNVILINNDTFACLVAQLRALNLISCKSVYPLVVMGCRIVKSQDVNDGTHACLVRDRNDL